MPRSVVVVVLAIGLAAGAVRPAGAANAPDLNAFSGCVSAHSAVAAIARGSTFRPAQRVLIAATIAASRTTGARKVAKGLRTAKSDADAAAALGAIAAWCTAHGVPPITLPPATTLG